MGGECGGGVIAFAAGVKLHAGKGSNSTPSSKQQNNRQQGNLSFAAGVELHAGKESNSTPDL